MSLKNLFSKQAQTILENQNVEVEKYVAWAETRFGKHAYWTGLLFGGLVFFFCLYLGFTGYQDKADSLIYLIIALFFGLFLASIFIGCGMMVKNKTTPLSTEDKIRESVLFEVLGFLRKTDLKYIKKISDRKWDAIRTFDLQAYKERELKRLDKLKPLASKNKITRLQNLKLIFRKASLCGIVLFLIMAAFFFFFTSPLALKLFGFSFSIMLIGLHAWFFLYALIGFLKKEIRIPGEWETNIFRGTSAVIWSIIFLTLGLFDLLAWLFIAGYLILY